MKRVLVFRHGIGVNRYLLLPMERYFRRRGFDVHNPTYPTTRKRIEDHAEDLAAELHRIHRELTARGEPHEIHAVGHSMGSLVIRYALSRLDVPPVRRAVLIAPPNQGTAMARGLQRFFLYRWVLGTLSARQLAQEPPGIFQAAGIPPSTEIGVLAGSGGIRFYPVRLDKPHDGMVSVSEAALPPFPMKVVPYGHTPILFVRSVWEEVEHFLDHGTFRSEA